MIRRSLLIHSSPDVQGGKPCLRGTRITVDSIKAVSSRLSVKQIMAEFPGASPEGIEAARKYRPARGKKSKVRNVQLKSQLSWSGWGVLSPKGMFLEATTDRSQHIVNLLDARPKGSRLVRVRATLLPVTRSLQLK